MLSSSSNDYSNSTVHSPSFVHYKIIENGTINLQNDKQVFTYIFCNFGDRHITNIRNTVYYVKRINKNNVVSFDSGNVNN